MDYLLRDDSLTSEYSDMSVDAIVAQFKAEMARESAASASAVSTARRNRPEGPRNSRGEHASMPSKQRKRDRQDRRAAGNTAAQSGFEHINAPAQPQYAAPAQPQYTAPAQQQYAAPAQPQYTAPAQQPQYAAPAPQPQYAAPAQQPDLASLGRAEYSFPRQEPRAVVTPRPAAPREAAPVYEAPREAAPDAARKPAPAPAAKSYERKSARPSDAEVRDFLDAYKRGDYLDLHERELSDPPVDPDSRYYMGGERRRTLRYGGREVDMSADENYTPPKAPEYISAYARENGDEEEPAPEKSGAFGGMKERLGGFIRGGKKRPAPAEEEKEPWEQRVYGGEAYSEEESADAEAPESPADGAGRGAGGAGYVSAYSAARRDERGFESGFDDDEPEGYAVKRDFEYDEEFPDPGPGSFREYVFSTFASLLYGFRRSGGARTMEDSGEDLGREVSCARASKYYGSFIRSMRLRLRISGVLLFIMGWISLGLPVSGMIKTAAGACALILGLQLGVMLLCLDVVTTAVMNAVRGKFGIDSLAVAACVLSSLDALLVAQFDVGTPHLALCFISSLSLTGVMFAALLHSRAMRKALRVPAIGKRCFAVTGETDPKSGDVTVLKSVRPPMGFVRRSEQSSPDEDVFRKLSLPLLALALLLSLLIAAVKRDFGDFVYIFSALTAASVPIAAMWSYSLPFFLGSMRIFPSGAAVAGWSGMSDIGQSKNLIVTDRDLFPDGTVEIGTIRIFADEEPTRIISYAGSMMAAAGSCSAPAFGALMERNGCRTRSIENYEYLSGGGMKGIIDGSVILCGSTDLMRLMNVRVPFRLVDRTSVLLAVDGILCGIFNMKYTAQPQVRSALIDLMRSNRHPVFAIRDFNVTPEMLHAAFDVATDGYDFPPYVDRFAMSSAEPGEDSQIAAVICREGLGPLAHAADTARSMYSATRLNTAMAVFSSLLGLLLTAIKLFGGGVSITFIFLFLLVWALLTGLVSFFARG